MKHPEGRKVPRDSDPTDFRSSIAALLAQKGIVLSVPASAESSKSLKKPETAVSNPRTQTPSSNSGRIVPPPKGFPEKTIEWAGNLYVIRHGHFVRISPRLLPSPRTTNTHPAYQSRPSAQKATLKKSPPESPIKKEARQNDSTLRSRNREDKAWTNLHQSSSRLPSQIRCRICGKAVNQSEFSSHVTVHKIQALPSTKPSHLYQVIGIDPDLGTIGACLICGHLVSLEFIRRHWFKVHQLEVKAEIEVPQVHVMPERSMGSLSNVSNWMEVTTSADGTALHGIGLIRRDWNGQFGSMSDFDASED